MDSTGLVAMGPHQPAFGQACDRSQARAVRRPLQLPCVIALAGGLSGCGDPNGSITLSPLQRLNSNPSLLSNYPLPQPTCSEPSWTQPMPEALAVSGLGDPGLSQSQAADLQPGSSQSMAALLQGSCLADAIHDGRARPSVLSRLDLGLLNRYYLGEFGIFTGLHPYSQLYTGWVSSIGYGGYYGVGLFASGSISVSASFLKTDDSIGVISANDVPAPLPSLGIATAFSCSRKLRKRLLGAQPPH